jgi:hypothetical protein
MTFVGGWGRCLKIGVAGVGELSSQRILSRKQIANGSRYCGRCQKVLIKMLRTFGTILGKTNIGHAVKSLRVVCNMDILWGKTANC